MARQHDLVFVTGATGYLGLHVVNQLLNDGFRVRGSARGQKYERLKKSMAGNSAFEAVQISDIGSGDFSGHLQGVDAVIHIAAPMIGRVPTDEAVKYASQGSVHILNEASKAGIKRAVVTSSIATFPFGGPYGPTDMNTITLEEIESFPFAPYVYQKTHADKAVMSFADAHPEMDIVILGPGWLFGPLAPQWTDICPEPDYPALATALNIYQLLRKDNTNYVNGPGNIDVRDTARIHIAALTAGPSENIRRFVVASPHPSSWSGAIEMLANERPELADRLADPKGTPSWPDVDDRIDLDAYREEQEKVLGFKRDMYYSWKSTVLDGVDSLLAIEKKWKENGFSPEPPK